MTWEGVLNENGGKLLIKEMLGTAKECVNGTNTVVMNSMEIKPTKIEEAEAKEEKGTVHWRFNMTIGGATKCTFEGNGTFTYTKGTDKSAFKESTLSSSPVACGTGKISGETTDEYLSEKEGWQLVKWL